MSRLTSACAIALAATPALANINLNTNYRAGSIALPTVDGRSSSDTSVAGAEQGRATYRLSIVTPPGKSGVEPTLALIYGGRGDGPLGAGWSLALPSIRVKTSGRGGQVAWGVDETYLGFSGEDLVDAGDLADVDGDGLVEDVMREERDLTFIRYIRYSAGGGWSAEYPDGKKLALGTTADGRVERAGQVARWLPQTLEDQSGNQLAYTWRTAQAVDATTLSPTERYLTSIRYGCQSCASATAYQEVRFGYAKRARPVLDFGPGFLVETELYLTSITTASFGTHAGDVRNYALGYDATANLLLLSSVTISTADAALPPITFGYTAASSQVIAETMTGVPGVLFKSGVEPIDLDKDGRVDVVDISTNSAKLYGNTGATAPTFPAIGTSITPPGAFPTSVAVSVVDKNRDLGADVHNLAGAQVYLHQGATGWAPGVATPQLPPVAMGTDTVHADIDLDGYPDLIDTSGSNWTIYFNDGTDNYQTDSVVCTSPTTPVVGSALHARNAGVLFGDVSADGLIDVVYVTAAGAAYVFPGRGRGCWGYLPEDGHGATAYTQLAVTSSGGFPVPANLRLADLDGDGFDDLVEVGAPSRLNIWRFTPGTGFVPTSGPWVQSNASTSGCRVADFDHDGVMEVACSTGWKLYDFTDQLPFMLSSVNNGLGVVTTFQYTTSARVAAAHATAGTPWTTNLAASVPVVSAIETTDGRGHVLVDSFDYRDAYYVTDELEDRYEFVGFGYVAERKIPWLESGGVRGTDPADAGELVRRYFDVGSTDYFLRGTPLCEETFAPSTVPSTFTCSNAPGPLVQTRWQNTATIDPTYGFVTIQRLAEDHYVAEGNAVPAWLRTEWTYDTYGNQLTQIEYGRYRLNNRLFGTDERMQATDYVVDTTAWNLRLRSRVRSGKITAAGALSALTIDYFAYDGAGRLEQQRSWFKNPITGVQSTVQTLRRTYTAEGMIESETDANLVVTSYAYDTSLGLFRTREELDAGGLALVQEMTFDSRTGSELRRVAPDGAVTEAAYDLLGRMRWLAKPGDSAVAPTVARSYVDAAPLSTSTDVSKDGTADGLIVTRSIDGHGRLVCERHEATASKGDIQQWDFSARGKLALSVPAFRDLACEPLTVRVTNGIGDRIAVHDHDRHVVDALGRPLSLAHSEGTARTWSYGILAVTESDEEDAKIGSPHASTPTTRTQDGLGRTIAVAETHVLDDDDPGTHTFTYQWDALGNLTRVVDSNARQIYLATYDSRSRRVRSVDADLGQTDTVYDLLGHTLSVTDARGVTIAMTWDDAGRALTRSGPDGITTYHYDVHQVPASTVACHSRGRLAYVTDPSGSDVFCYDARGNLTRDDKTIAAQSPAAFVTELAYDALDRLLSQRNPDTTTLSYTYGGDGRIFDVRATSPTGDAFTLATMLYTASGQVNRATLGNGGAVTRTYDRRQRPLRITAKKALTTWLDFTLAHDGVGNLTSLTDAVSEESMTLTYDNLYRLTSATGDRFAGATQTFRYDRSGNLTRKESSDVASPAHVGTLVYAHPAKFHAVTLAGGQALTYDAAGHLEGDGTHAFTWNDRGLLATVEDAVTGAEVYSVGYDHLDRRVFKASASGDIVAYVPAAGAELRTEAGTATWVTRVAVAGMDIARIDGSFTLATVAAHVVFPIGDHLGTPSLVVDAAGAVVERSSTHPFGEENTASLAAAGTLGDYVDPNDPATTLERRYQGRERDETGDYDFGARMLRPHLGRFMAADTVVPDPSSSQSWNRYSFVRNNPMRYIDPTGHAEVEATAPAAPEGALPGATPIPQVPPSEWTNTGGRDGVDWKELEQATGDDSMGWEYLDPLLKFKSQKLKGSVEAGPVGGEVAVDLSNGKVTAGVSHSNPLAFGAKMEGKCTSAPTCEVGIKTDIPIIPAYPFSAKWKPLQDEISLSVGPHINMAGVKIKLVVETAWTYSTETASRYGHRLWKSFTETPQPAPTP